MDEMLKLFLESWQNPGDGWRRVPAPPDLDCFQKGESSGYLMVVVERRRISRDDATIFPKGRWHLSISFNCDTPKGKTFPRLPSWEEIKEVRYKFLPNEVNMAIMFPPKELYFNLHPTCINLLEIPVGMALDPKINGPI